MNASTDNPDVWCFWRANCLPAGFVVGKFIKQKQYFLRNCPQRNLWQNIISLRYSLCVRRWSLVRRFFCFLTVLVWLGTPAQASPQEPLQFAAARNVKVYTEDFAPFNYVTPKGLAGAGAEIVRAMAVLVGYQSGFEVLPWKRALQIVKTEPDTALFSIVRTPEREDEFKWVGPIFITRGWLYRMADNKIDVSDLSDARKVRSIGVQAGGAAERSLREMGFENLESLYTPGNALRMLSEGRIDLWEASDIAMNFQREMLGLEKGSVVPTVELGQYDMYLAFSKSTPDATLEPWRRALEIVQGSGMADVIARQYGLGDQSVNLTARTAQ